MTATNDQVPDNEPGALQALLPWYANGTLSASDARRVEQALAQDPALAAELAAIRDEAAETIHLNETLGAPSSQAMHKLFAAIDAEPPRGRSTGPSLSARVSGFFAGLSPRALTSAAAAVAVVLVLQAAVIAGVLVENYGAGKYQTASYQATKAADATIALVRFAPDARISDINELLAAYHAGVVDGPKAGMFRIAIGDKPLPKDERERLMARLQAEKIVGFAAAE
jgi:anti-sigma factor RsiW